MVDLGQIGEVPFELDAPTLGPSAIASSVSSRIESHIGTSWLTILVDHRIMFANYVVKLPDADEVPQHAEWTFLDEDRFRSATSWCPL